MIVKMRVALCSFIYDGFEEEESCDSDHGLQAWEAETFIRLVKSSRQSRAFGC